MTTPEDAVNTTLERRLRKLNAPAFAVYDQTMRGRAPVSAIFATILPTNYVTRARWGKTVHVTIADPLFGEWLDIVISPSGETCFRAVRAVMWKEEVRFINDLAQLLDMELCISTCMTKRSPSGAVGGNNH